MEDCFGNRSCSSNAILNLSQDFWVVMALGSVSKMYFFFWHSISSHNCIFKAIIVCGNE